MKQTDTRASMCDKRHDLLGKQFGRLTVIGISKRKHHVICRCECGNNIEIYLYNLTRKDRPTRSCGCFALEVRSKQGLKIGGDKSRPTLVTNVRYNTNFQVIEKTDPRKDNTSGKTGVFWDKRRNKWAARIRVHNKSMWLGYYTSFDDAVKARQIAEDKYHKPLIEAKNEEVVDV